MVSAPTIALLAALALVLALPHARILRARILPLIVGCGAVFCGAFATEIVIDQQVPWGWQWVLPVVVVAPLVEEASKLAGVVGLSRLFPAIKVDTGSAAGVGIGFAVSESCYYFVFAYFVLGWASFLVLSLMRGLLGPIVHSAGSILTAAAWKGWRPGFPIAIGIHAGLNGLTVFGPAFTGPPYLVPLGFLGLIGACGSILLFVPRRFLDDVRTGS